MKLDGFMESLKLLYKKDRKTSNSFSQSPEKWLSNHKIDLDISGLSLEDIKRKIHKIVLGETKCKNCRSIVERLLPGWNGFCKTCCDECEKSLSSKRMSGDNNSYHKLSKQQKLNSAIKQSETLKNKIKKGLYTPKSENYRTHKMIEFELNGVIVKVRSLWEMLYYLENPTHKYEEIRLEYFDSIKNKKRIYISDFYDEETNTIIEIKPLKYISTLKDKEKAVKKLGYNYKILSEDYFSKFKNDEKLIEQIKSCSHDKELIERRLKWLK